MSKLFCGLRAGASWHLSLMVLQALAVATAAAVELHRCYGAEAQESVAVAAAAPKLLVTMSVFLHLYISCSTHSQLYGLRIPLLFCL